MKVYSDEERRIIQRTRGCRREGDVGEQNRTRASREVLKESEDRALRAGQQGFDHEG